jgi:hypothetical protein
MALTGREPWQIGQAECPSGMALFPDFRGTDDSLRNGLSFMDGCGPYSTMTASPEGSTPGGQTCPTVSRIMRSAAQAFS